MKTQHIIFMAGLGLGAYFFLTKKAAATPSGQQLTGDAMVWNRATQRPGVGTSVPTFVQEAGAFQAVGNTVANLWNTFANPAIVRPAGYIPEYVPDNAGEAAARSYYLNNQDSFAVNPPDQYQSYTGTTGGYLDSQ